MVNIAKIFLGFMNNINEDSRWACNEIISFYDYTNL